MTVLTILCQESGKWWHEASDVDVYFLVLVAVDLVETIKDVPRYSKT